MHDSKWCEKIQVWMDVGSEWLSKMSGYESGMTDFSAILIYYNQWE